MVAEIISIGQELLLGEITDTNASYLSDMLSAAGIDVKYHTCVGDYASQIQEALTIAVGRSELIFTTGGLGPTKDDLTREVISEFSDCPLRLHKESLRRIEQIFKLRNLNVPPVNRIQAMIPEGATVIKNEHGTAPGFLLIYKGIKIISLPGVPSEMKSMFQSIYPLLKEKNEDVIHTKLLNCFGIPESLLGEKLGNLMDRNSNPSVGTRVKNGVIAVRIHAKGKTEKETKKLISETEKDIRSRLGDVIFGEGHDLLEHAVAQELSKKRLTLSVAESCTGGLISHKLTNVPGISEYFLESVVSYSNNAKIDLLKVPEELIKKHGAVSKKVAEAMAAGVKSLSRSDYAISVTGIAGPAGGTYEKPVGLVYIALTGPSGTEVQKFQFTGSREEIKERAALSALNMLRMKLTKLKKNDVSREDSLPYAHMALR
ncbi:MAG: competence/damage-inducible protein A [Candidatus Eremiobacterota bacterium]